MWYFSWILGIGVALGFGIINVMWLEANGKFTRDATASTAADGAPEQEQEQEREPAPAAHKPL